MLPSTKDIIIDTLEKTKVKKMQKYNESYLTIRQSVSDLFEEILRENNLLENIPLLRLIEIHKERIDELHKELLISIENYCNKEKAKISLMMTENLDDSYPKTINELEQYLEKNFEIILFQISNKLHVRLEIQKMIQQLQIENNIN